MANVKLVVVTIGICSGLSLSGCAGFLEELGLLRSGASGPRSAPSPGGSVPYGDEAFVRATVDRVKTGGEITVISSRAIRLPSHPLNSITAFDYSFPGACGGHQFRVYESDGTQILEFQYEGSAGRRFLIRDYVAGPNPFIEAGLWSAYDHTADSVGNMTLNYVKRGSGLLRGTYSQGPVTGLDQSSRQVLGRAYDNALRDARQCRG